MTRGEQATHQIERPDAFEHRDVGPRGVIIFFISLGTGILLTLVVVFGLYKFMAKARSAEAPFPTMKEEQKPPEPRIQPEPRLDVWKFQAETDAKLNSYGWVDQKAGVARIPIGRAIELLSQRGLPARMGAEAGAGVPNTGPESGGPQTGKATPRVTPQQPVPGLDLGGQGASK
jgi:hypothetical protein